MSESIGVTVRIRPALRSERAENVSVSVDEGGAVTVSLRPMTHATAAHRYSFSAQCVARPAVGQQQVHKNPCCEFLN